MKKRIVKKYHLKEEVKACLMIAFAIIPMFMALLYQSAKVEEERQEKKDQTVIYVNFTK